MNHEKLNNKPLVEAIFEIRWKLQPKTPGFKVDPHYKLFLGRLFDRLSGQFPEHEQLPAAEVPDVMVAHTVQHRFRTRPGEWPVVQVGPGIQTFNSTDDYAWETFRPGIIDLVQRVIESYPNPDELAVESVVLRYVDAVEFNYNSNDVFVFLRDLMQLKIDLPDGLFSDHSVDSRPKTLNWNAAFDVKQPAGQLQLRFATGQVKQIPSIVWETTFQTTGSNVPEIPADFELWLDGAHEIVNDCFFKLIEGELERRFRGD